jgi:hypothetical protein
LHHHTQQQLREHLEVQGDRQVGAVVALALDDAVGEP